MSLGTSSDSDSNDIVNLEDGDGWEDVEPDIEKVKIVSLFSDDEFDDIKTMLEHCKVHHQFDLIKIRKELDLDFLETIKLVNYIRREVQSGRTPRNVSIKSTFEDDQYLLPVLEDDALLYTLEDAIGDIETSKEMTQDTDRMSDRSYDRVIFLEKENVLIKKQLDKITNEYTGYKAMVTKMSDNQMQNLGDYTDSSTTRYNHLHSTTPGIQDDDSHYFNSYSYNEIHETMLKDHVRTEAYRDFMYDNKNLFFGKIVLDVGCGTGILSMFCARAGAAKVIAVDNSDIIDKARETIFRNGMGNIVTCLHGKIEDAVMPVPKVDIIVSEWMGYCLLYEAMLDSVLWARDRYLAADGLMVPSNTTLYLAPLTDPEYVAEHISFWKSVYGFDMTSMTTHIYDEVLIRDLETSILAAEPVAFLRLSLHTAKKDELTFSGQAFTMTLKADVDSLDGFVIWFDTFFLPDQVSTVPDDAKAENWGGHERKGVAFTTGPGGPKTHWRQGVLLIDHSKRPAEALRKGQVIEGEIGYKKRSSNSRELEIEIKWNVAGHEETGVQVWYMR